MGDVAQMEFAAGDIPSHPPFPLPYFLAIWKQAVHMSLHLNHPGYLSWLGEQQCSWAAGLLGSAGAQNLLCSPCGPELGSRRP